MSWYDLDNEALKTASTVRPVMKIPGYAHPSTAPSLLHPPKSSHSYAYLTPLPSQTESAPCYSSNSLHLSPPECSQHLDDCNTLPHAEGSSFDLSTHCIRTPIQQAFKGTYTAVSCGNVNGLMTGVCTRVDGETTVKDQICEWDVVACCSPVDEVPSIVFGVVYVCTGIEEHRGCGWRHGSTTLGYLNKLWVSWTHLKYQLHLDLLRIL
jgi:hypothetical protein